MATTFRDRAIIIITTRGTQQEPIMKQPESTPAAPWLVGRCRARALGIAPGILSPDPLNALTDVAGVRVGHVTLSEGEDLRTGVTAILPHGGNLYQNRVPAGVAVGNGFGKLIGSTQVVELGEIETPIALTNTLAVPQAAEAVIAWTLAQPGNEEVVSVNPVVGETNDSRLNDIRRSAVTVNQVLAAILPSRSISRRWL